MLRADGGAGGRGEVDLAAASTAPVPDAMESPVRATACARTAALMSLLPHQPRRLDTSPESRQN